MRNVFAASSLLFLSISAVALPHCDQEPFDNCIATATSAAGSKYVGEWMNGKPHGQGTYTWTDGHTKYIGQWKDDKRHGQGILVWLSGAIYVGEFQNDNKHGQGIYTWPDGDNYVGEWKDDNRHGFAHLKAN